MQRACERRTSRSGSTPQHHYWIELVFEYTGGTSDSLAGHFPRLTRSAHGEHSQRGVLAAGVVPGPRSTRRSPSQLVSSRPALGVEELKLVPAGGGTNDCSHVDEESHFLRTYTFNLLTLLVMFAPFFSRNTISPNSKLDQSSVPSVKGSEAKMTAVASSTVHSSKAYDVSSC